MLRNSSVPVLKEEKFGSVGAISIDSGVEVVSDSGMEAEPIAPPNECGWDMGISSADDTGQLQAEGCHAWRNRSCQKPHMGNRACNPTHC